MKAKSILLLLAFVLFLPTIGYADGKVAGWCENGGFQVSVPGGTASSANRFQRSFPSCTVTVYLPGTTTLATIYSDGSGTAKANPFTAASTGQWFFYADDGRYDVRFSGGGIPAPFTVGDLIAFDTARPAEVRVPCNPAFTAATTSGKITNAIADLPATGGVIDLTCFQGAQTLTTTVTIDKPVDLIFGASTFTCTATPVCLSITSPDGVTIEGINPSLSVLYVSVTGSDGINPATNTVIKNITLKGPNSASSGFSGVDGGSNDDVTIDNVVFQQWGSHCLNTGATSNRWKITRSVFSNCFDDSILVGSGSARIEIIGNFFTNSSSTTGNNAIDLNGSYNLVAHNVLLNMGREGGATDDFGILIQAVTGEDANFNVIDSNQVVGSGAQSIIIRALTGRTASYNVVNNNLITTGGQQTAANGHCISIDGTSVGTTSYNQISNNTCQAGYHGILVDGTSATAQVSNRVFGNLVQGCTGTGIYVSNATTTDTVLHNNTTVGCGTALTDLGTRTSTAGNKINLTDAIYRIEQVAAIGGASLSVGPTPATAGVLRTGNNLHWNILDSDGSTNRPTFGMDSSDQTIIQGGGGTNTILLKNSSGTNMLAISETGNLTIPGVTANSTPTISLGGVTFANLGTPSNGIFVYCSDCTKATPCASGGSGAFAFRLNSAWECNP